jgi:hypothetical protein
MSNLLELPLALCWGRHKTPHKKSVEVGDNHQLRSMILQSPGHLGVDKRDDATQCNALEAHQSHLSDESSVQVSGFRLLSSQRVYAGVPSVKRVAKASHKLYL